MAIPRCERCDDFKQQRGRYGDFYCPCCDESVRCKHVSVFKRALRRFLGRRA